MRRGDVAALQVLGLPSMLLLALCLVGSDDPYVGNLPRRTFPNGVRLFLLSENNGLYERTHGCRLDGQTPFETQLQLVCEGGDLAIPGTPGT
jgi:hypothetical protein